MNSEHDGGAPREPAPAPGFAALGQTQLRPPTIRETTWDYPAAGAVLGAPAGADPAETADMPPTVVPAARPPSQTGPRLGRYVVGRELGRGGMGRVVEAYDPELRREVAIKIILGGSAVDAVVLERFAAEAQVTSQLEHPSIVPVHDCGVSADGRLYYVMKKVAHDSLRDLLAELADQRPGTVRAAPGEARGRAADWSLHRLVSAFVKVCDAVAYAHSRGVLHRDLKPANIMVGDFGEVLVLDWGIARLLDSPALRDASIARVTLDETLVGSVLGTPGYMSPEQLRGELDELDERSDVWSLGAVLYELLTLTRAYAFSSVLECLAVISTGPPDDPRRRAPWAEIPPELAELTLRALEPEKERRVPSARALAEEGRAFLEGSRRRSQALAIVREAEPIEAAAAAARDRAVALRHEAGLRLRGVPAFAPVEDKLGAWALEDEAAHLEERAKEAELRFRLTLQNALNLAPDLPQPHRLLASHYRRHHATAEALGDRLEAATWEALLRHHDRGEHAEYLAGKGAFSLVTEPVGAEVELLRYEQVERRLEARSLGVIGRTPLRAVELEMGSYLLVIRAPGRAEVRFPLRVRRGELEDGVPPGQSEPLPIALPAAQALGADDVYVPAGWVTVGGDPQGQHAFPPRRYWLDAFVIKRHPVTNAEYLALLDALVAAGLEEEALQYAPRERGTTWGTLGPMVYGRDARGRFELVADADGDVWHPRWPVMMVRWDAAMRYAAWQRERDGHAWRLPHELEWEKAARGADGRFFPWGDFLDPSWLCMAASRAGRPVPTPVEDYPLDQSPYGVRGLGGNVVDWCWNAFEQEPPDGPRPRLEPWTAGRDVDDLEARVALRGGSWNFAARACRSARRSGTSPSYCDSYLGFRLARPWSDPAGS